MAQTSSARRRRGASPGPSKKIASPTKPASTSSATGKRSPEAVKTANSRSTSSSGRTNPALKRPDTPTSNAIAAQNLKASSVFQHTWTDKFSLVACGFSGVVWALAFCGVG